MPDDAIGRARLMDMRLRGHSMALLEYKRYDPAARNDMTNADAVKYGEFLEEVRQLLLAFASQQAPGMVLVPREPTEAMLEAGEVARIDNTDRYLDGSEVARAVAPAIWSAMLDAAPSVTLAGSTRARRAGLGILATRFNEGGDRG